MSAHHREAVGHYRCPNTAGCENTGIIYRQRDGVLYGVCKRCGPLYWRTPEGQEFFLSKGTIWGAAGPPPEIAEELARVNKRRKPSATPAPLPALPATPAAPERAAPPPAISRAAPNPKPTTTPTSPAKPRAWWNL